MINEKGTGYLSGKLVVLMKATSSKITGMALEFASGSMDHLIKENGSLEFKMARESLLKKMEQSDKESSKIMF